MTEIIEKPAMQKEMFKNEYLTPLAHAIMNLFIQNISIQQIAERLGHNRSYGSSLVNAPNFQHMLSIRRATVADGIDERVINSEKEAADALRAHAKEIAENMARLALEGESETIMLRAGSDVLDRVGPQKGVKGADIAATVVMIDIEGAKLIKETAEMIQE